MKNSETMMRVKKTTLDKLKQVGKMGESYNDVLERLVKKELGD